MPNSKFDSFYSEIYARISGRYPSAAGHIQTDWLKHSLSPHTIEVPLQTLKNAQSAVEVLHRLTHTQRFIDWIGEHHDLDVPPDGGEASVLMAYDFHMDSSGRLGLIEINTNAAGFVLAENLNPKDSAFPNALEDLKRSFLAEMNGLGRPVERIAIIDDRPEAQKMYPEFLMYQELFGQWGYRAEIADFRTLVHDSASNELRNAKGQRIDFVYNRWTDFLLQHPDSKHLRRAYDLRSALFSPNPREYLLLADKGRLIDLCSRPLADWNLSPTDQASIEKVLLKTFSSSEFSSAEEIWQRRKQYFFKPSRSFGSKAVYRGSSISRKAFESIQGTEYIVQEFMPAPEIPLDGEDWKYDLRFYVYRDQIQFAVARLYQGQVTNFSREHGGFARLKFV